MDRIAAMRVFVAAADEGALVRAGRMLGRSPAAVSRALAALEAGVGVRLLNRTTRSIGLTEAGERYLSVCRRVLEELEAAELIAAEERSEPAGVLRVTAPVAGGERILRPILAEFMKATPAVNVELQLIDRPVNLIEEGMDVAFRFAELQDRGMTAVPVGEVRRQVVAAPAYLRARGPIRRPEDLAGRDIISMTHFGLDRWSFPPAEGGRVPRSIPFRPRFVVNTVRAAVASAVEGQGVTRLFSYHVAEEVRAGALEVLLRNDEPEPWPIHLLAPQGRLALPRVQAFFDFTAPRLRAYFDALCDV